MTLSISGPPRSIDTGDTTPERSALSTNGATESVRVAGRLPHIERWFMPALRRASELLDNNLVPGHIRKHFARRASSQATIFTNRAEAIQRIKETVREAHEILRVASFDAQRLGSLHAKDIQIDVSPQAIRITKVLATSIGKTGERGIRIVVERSGNIVTAFPIKAVVGISGAAAVGVATSQQARAIDNAFDEHVVDAVTRLRTARSAQQSFDPVNEMIGLIDPTGVFFAEPTADPETRQGIVRDAQVRLCKTVEQNLHRPLTPIERKSLIHLFSDALSWADFSR